MIKYCPFMSYRSGNVEGLYCMDNSCALYDEENCQCCFKTQALTAAAKSSGNTAQASYVIPSSYHQTNAVSNIHLPPPAEDKSYIQF